MGLLVFRVQGPKFTPETSSCKRLYEPVGEFFPNPRSSKKHSTNKL